MAGSAAGRENTNFNAMCNIARQINFTMAKLLLVESGDA